MESCKACVLVALARAQMGPASNRTIAANANAMNDLAASIRANPRFGRLLMLAGDKNCQM